MLFLYSNLCEHSLWTEAASRVEKEQETGWLALAQNGKARSRWYVTGPLYTWAVSGVTSQLSSRQDLSSTSVEQESSSNDFKAPGVWL